MLLNIQGFCCRALILLRKGNDVEENRLNFLNKTRTLLKEIEPGSSIHHTAGTSTSSHTEVSIHLYSSLIISSHFASVVLKYYLKERWETENI